ncbi:hypothetical protein [Enterococcus hulanensis]|uniref:hypothetical protein n=1 Tax=Enterococcus hulanensis TaxID=2559929 RepID=UPI0010F69F5B|nr:hypothetical protein [Enterococcus hulanensis]
MTQKKTDGYYYFKDKDGSSGFYQIDGERELDGSVKFHLVDKQGEVGPNLSYEISAARPENTFGNEVAIKISEQEKTEFLLNNRLIENKSEMTFESDGEKYAIHQLTNVGKLHASFFKDMDQVEEIEEDYEMGM